MNNNIPRPLEVQSQSPITGKSGVALMLADAFREFEKDASAAVAVLWGEGGSFCAGADLKALAGESTSSPNQMFMDMAKDGPMGPSRMHLAGDLAPRSALILVEFESREAFENYCNDPALKDLHPHRTNGTSNYIWQLFDKLSDLRPILNTIK